MTEKGFYNIRMDARLFACLCVMAVLWDHAVEAQDSKPEVCVKDRMDLVFIIDASTSVGSDNFKLVIRFVEQIVKDLNIDNSDVRVGLLMYSTSTEIRFTLGQHNTKQKILEEIRAIQYTGGSTNTADALLAMRTKVFGTNEDRPGVKNVAIVITDGLSNINSGRTVQEASDVHNDGVIVYGIGIGLQDTRELDAIASSPTNTFRHNVQDFNQLDALKNQIFPSNCGVGGGILQPGPLDLFGTSCGSQKMDLVLLVDSSKNSSNEFAAIRNFLFDFVEYADVDSGAVRVALVSFSTGPRLHFRLDRTSDLAEVQKGIREAEFRPGERNTADALDLLRRRVFFEPYGDRPDAPDVVLLITTGEPERNTHRTVQEASTLKQLNVNILVIGIGAGTEVSISEIASDPVEENIFIVQDLQSLQEELFVIKDLVFIQICALSRLVFLTPAEGSDSLDLVFLLHFSDKMTQYEFDLMINFIENLLEGADVDADDVRVGIALYNLEGSIVFDLNRYSQDKDALLRGIRTISYSSRSKTANLAAGLNIVRLAMFQDVSGDRSDVPNALIVLTDANSNSQFVRRLPNVVSEMKQTGATIFSIGVGLSNDDEVNSLATSSEFSFVLNDMGQLPAVTKRIQARLPSLQAVLLPPEIPTPAPEVVEKITRTLPPVQVTTKKTVVTLEYSDEADVLVIFHSGHKTKARDFNKRLKIFIANLFAKANIDKGKVRGALINYGVGANLLFDFNRYNKKKDLRGYIRKLKAKLRNSNSNLLAAMRMARTQVFTAGRGARTTQDVPGAVILITDMKANTPLAGIMSEVEELKKLGISFFTLGIGKADETELQSIASQPVSEYYQKIAKYDELTKNPDVIDHIIRGIYSLQGASYKGQRRTTSKPIIVTKPPIATTKPIIITKPTTAPQITDIQPPITTPDPKDPKVADIVIIFHAYPSIKKREFKKYILKYIVRLVKKADIDGGKVRIAIMTYGEKGQIVLQLDQFSSKKTILKGIKKIPKSLRFQKENLQDALLKARRDILASKGRKYVKQYVILITDAPYTRRKNQTTFEDDILKAQGVTIHVVAVGVKDASGLKSVASSPVKRHFLLVKDIQDLKKYKKAGKPVVRRISALRKKRKKKKKGKKGVKVKKGKKTKKGKKSKKQKKHKKQKKTKKGKKNKKQKQNKKGKKNRKQKKSKNGKFKNTSKPVKKYVTNKIDPSEMTTERLAITSVVLNVSSLNFDNRNSRQSVPLHSKPNTRNFMSTTSISVVTNNPLKVTLNITRKRSLHKGQTISAVAKNASDSTGFPMYVGGYNPGSEDATVKVIDSSLRPSHFVDYKFTIQANENPNLDDIMGTTESPKENPNLDDIMITTENPKEISDIALTTGNVKDNKVETYEAGRVSEPLFGTEVGRSNIYKDDTACGSLEADIAIALDASLRTNRAHFIEFADMLIQKLEAAINSGSVRVSLNTFTDRLLPKFSFDTYTDTSEMLDSVRTLSFRGGRSNIATTISMITDLFGRGKGTRQTAPDIAIMVLGQSRRRQNLSNIKRQAQRSRSRGIETFVLGIGDFNNPILQAIASKPILRHLFPIEMARVLTEMPEETVTHLCQAVAPVPVLSLKESGAADIVFAIHSSSSADTMEFDMLLNFLVSLISRADIDNGQVQTGLLVYNEYATPIFYFNQYKSSSQIKNAILNLSNRLRSDNVDAATAMRKSVEMFSSGYGARATVPKALFMITDASSTVNAADIEGTKSSLKAMGIDVFSIGVGLRDKSELEAIATSSENIYSVAGYEKLNRAENELRRNVRSLRVLPAPPVTDAPQTPVPPILRTTTAAAPVVIGGKTTKATIPIVTLPSHDQGCFAKVDIVFVLDSSTSVGEQNYKKMLKFCKDFLHAASIDSGDVRVGIVSYSTSITVEFQMNRYNTKAEIYDAIDNIPWRYGSTNTADALKTMHTDMFTTANGDRPDVRNIAIVVTDGVSNINSRRTIPEAEAARAKGIQVYAIGIGLTDKREVNGIASIPATDNAFFVTDFDELEGLDEQIFQTFCPDFYPKKTTAAPTPKPITPSPPLVTACNAKVDLIFVLDSSTSVGQDNFLKMLKFCKEFLHAANIDSGDVRVGVVTYSTQVTVEFQMNEYSTKQDVLNAIDAIPWRYGSTNTADGILTMHNVMFTAVNGDRPDVDNVALVMTDGVSNINSRRTIPEADRAHQKNIHVYAIGIGLTDMREVNEIASEPPSENAFAVKSFDDLEGLDEQIFSAICPATPPPPIDGNWANWMEWTACSITCSSTTGGPVSGVQSRSRTCTSPAPENGGAPCEGSDLETRTCTPETKCRVNGNWGPWGPYSECSISCKAPPVGPKIGSRTRYRSCDNPPAQFGGEPCPGPASETSSCEPEKYCPIDGNWSEWGSYSECSITCTSTDGSGPVSGKHTRTRTCNNPPAQYGGQPCPGPDTEMSACTPVRACPIITLPPKTECFSKVDLVFILDSSTSVGENNYKKMLQFCKDFLHAASIDSGDVRVGIVSYSTSVTVEFQMNEYSTKQEIYDAIDQIPWRYGSTNTADALQTMHEDMFTLRNGDRPDVKNMAIIVTDGVSNINSRRTIPEAEAARAKNIHIYAIGIGLTDVKEVNGIASIPAEDNAFFVKNFDELEGLDEDIFQSLCEGVLTSPKPVTQSTTTPITTIAPPISACNAKVDLVFVLDSSTSVGQDNFAKMQKFCKEFLHAANIDSGDVRVGVVTYSTDVTVEFHMNQYSTRQEVFDAIDAIPWRYGSTNTADGLLTMHDVMFSAQNGDRLDVDNVALVMTDGVSNINSRRTIPEADAAHQKNIHVYAIGIGLTDMREVNEIATEPASENAFAVKTFDDLEGLDEQIFSSICPATVPPSVDGNWSEWDPWTPCSITCSSTTGGPVSGTQSRSRTCTNPAPSNGGAPCEGEDMEARSCTPETKCPVNGNWEPWGPYSECSISCKSATGGPVTGTRSRFRACSNPAPQFGGEPCPGPATETISCEPETFCPIDGNWSEWGPYSECSISCTSTDGSGPVSGTHSRTRTCDNPPAIYGGQSCPGVDSETSSCTPENVCPIITTVAPQCFQKVDMVFILDSSTSVGQDNYKKMLQFCKEFLHAAEIDSGDVRVGIVSYSTSVTVEFQMNEYSTKQEIFDAIDNIPWRYGSTNTADALQTMHENMFTVGNGDRPDVRDIAIIVTDGVSNVNSRRTIPEAEAARAKNIHIYAIGIGLTDVKEVNGIASIPASENAFFVKNFDELEGLDEDIFTSLCAGITPPPPVVTSTTMAPTPKPTMPPPPPIACNAKVDMVFVLDSSTSVGQDNFAKMQKFCKEFLHSANIDNGDVRVGIVTYSTKVTVEFHMNEYSTTQEVYDAIDAIPWRYGSTNTADGLLTMHDVMFTFENGDRPDVDNVAVVMTDGVSNVNSRRTIPEADAAHQKNIHVYAIGIGLTDMREVNEIASEPPSENAFAVKTFDDLEGLDEQIFSSICPATEAPPIDGNWSEWDAWTPCSITCSSTTGGPVSGTQSRSRTCTNPAPSNGGAPCEGDNMETRSCTPETICPVDGNWGPWGPYSECSISCKSATDGPVTGTYTRYRSCDNPPAQFGGEPCPGPATETSPCDPTTYCPIDGNWSAWGPYSQCSITCSSTDGSGPVSGTHSRTRTCTNPPAQYGGQACLGSHTETSSCTPENACPIITSPAPVECFARIDMVFILDSSTSVGEANYKKMLQFCKDFLHSANIDSGDVRVGIVSYSTDVTVEFQMNDYTTKQDIYNAIDNIPWRYGSTNTADGLQTMHEEMFTVANGDRPDVDNIAIIVTDGVSNINSRRTITEAEAARAKNIHIYAIGIGLTDEREVNGIASDPPEKNAFFVSNFDELEGLDESIFSSICPETTPAPTTPKPRDSGYDVVVVMDSSVPKNIFGWMKGFVRSITKSFSIDDEEYKVGLLRYSTNPDTQWQLDEYSKGSDVVRAVDRVPYLSGDRNTAQAIDYVTKQMFRTDNGDRDFARNFIILLTGIAGSTDRYEAWLAAENAEKEGARLFTIGINLNDTTEIDEISSHPLSTYRYLINSESDLKGIPDDMRVSLSGMPKQPGPYRPRPRRPPPVTSPAPTECFTRIDMIFILDSSTSVGEANYKKMLQFCKDFLHSANIDSGDVRVGIVSYSTDVTVEFQMNDYTTKQDIYNAIDNIPWRYGSTNTADGLQTMHQEMFTVANGDRPDVDNIAIIVTDGVSNINSRRTIPEAEAARAKNIHIYAIGIGLTDEREVNGIASDPPEKNAFFVSDFDELEGLDESIFSSICPGVLTPAPTTKISPKTTPAPTTPKPRDSGYDVVVVMDSSVPRNIFGWMKGFVSSIAKSFSIDDEEYKVGLLRYGTNPDTQWQLNEYSKGSDVVRAVDRVPYLSGERNTAQAIDYVTKQMFKTDNGDRDYARNFIILLTGKAGSPDQYEAWLAAENAEKAGARLFTIGINLNDTTEIDEISSHPLSTYRYLLNSESDLKGIPDEMKVSLGGMPKQPGPYRPRPRRPIITSPAPTECFTRIDMIFILDSSTSVGEANYKKMLQFCKDFLHSANIDSGDVRVGIVSYSTDVTVEFQMNDYTTKQEIYNAIDNIPWRYGSTNTADGLQTMHQEMFTVANGDRPDVDNIAIIVTDGVSNINSRRTIPEAEAARAKNIHIYAIGIGLTDEREVNGIASDPPEKNAFFVSDFDELEGLDESIFSSICPGVFTPEPTKEKPQTPAPPIDGNWSEWDAWTPCSITCSSTTGGTVSGFQSRTRKCNNPAPSNGGAPCEGAATEGRECTPVTFCPVDGNWSEWEDWTPCSITCSSTTGGPQQGVQTRTRTCSNPAPAYGGRSCEGESSQTETCEPENYCPVDGQWSAWGNWSQCSATCGEASRTRSRTCSNPAPQFGGAACPGEATQTGSCNLEPCVTQCFAKIDLIFVLDSSTSVGQDNYEKMLQFCKDFLHAANVDGGDVRVGIVSYSTDVTIEFHLNEYNTKQSLFEAIDNIPWRYGSTNTADGLQTMHATMFSSENGDRPDVDNIAVVITDGVSNINSRRTIPEAVEARKKNIHIYTIGIGLTDMREVNGIASEPASKNAFAVQNFDELEGLDESIFDSICPGVKRTTPAPVKTTKETTKAPPTTLAPTTTEGQCFDNIDLIFILDSSTSVGEDNFKKMLSFCKEFLHAADIDSGAVKVGIVTYSTEVTIEFHLDEYSDRTSLFNAIDAIPWRYGSTNTADGLKTMHNEMFIPERGDRQGVPNICVIMTDGVSNINSAQTIPEAVSARADGIKIYAVGIGLTDMREVNGIASDPPSVHAFAVQTFDDLEGLDETIFSSSCPGRTPAPTVTEKATTPAPTTPVPTTPRGCFAQVDMIFILDSSTSVGQDNFAKMLKFCKDFLHSANIDSDEVRVGIVSYSTDVTVEFQMNTYSSKTALFDAIDNIPWRYGSTNTADGLLTMHSDMFTKENGDRPGVPNIAIIVTDGVSNVNSQRTIKEAETARAKGIHVYAIGIGLTDTREVNGIASAPAAENAFFVQSFDELEGLDEQIFEATCGGIKTAPPRKTEAATTPLPPMTSPKPTCGLAKVDLVIILDSSTSVGQENFNKMLEFCKEFLANSDIDSGSVRVGMLSYSTEVFIHFYLDDHTTSADMFNAIDNIPWNFGSTNTADGLKTMRNQLFTSSRGDRPDVKNVAMIITDGVSNINARDTVPQAELARNDGIHVYAIGIGLSDRTELDAIASVPASENSFAVQSFDELKGLERKIFQSICPGIISTLKPTTPRATLAPITTRAPVTTPSSTPAPTTPKPPLDLGYDVVIVMDSSVNNRNFGWMKDFVRNIAQSFSIDDEEYKVGLLRYSTNPRVQWQLNEYDRKNDVIRAVDRVSRRGGRRNTAQALDYVKNEMFRRRNGDRDIARNFIILLTGEDESPDRYRAWQSAEQAEVDGIRLFTVGINLRDTTEIDEISSHPLSTYRYLINRESDLQGVPDKMRDALRRMPRQPGPARPRPTRPPTTTTTTAAPLDSVYDVVIVMDSSVPRDTFDWMKGFVRSISESFSIDNEEYKVGVLRYSTYPQVQWNLREYRTKNDIIRAVDRIGYNPGRTNTAQALEYVRNSMFRRSAGDRDFARDFVILLTGQDESTDKYRAWAAAERAESEGIRVFTVGINLNDTSEIDEISSHPLTTYRYLVRKQSDLLAVPGIMKLSLNDMPERPEPARPRPERPTTPRPTIPPRPPGNCTSKGDIVFILDSSGSVGRNQFYKVLNFTYTTVSDLDIDTGNFRVSVISFSDNARLEFNLNRYTTKAEVENALKQVDYVYGSTHTAEALRMAREQVFTGSGGDRPGVPNVVIIITDGESNINNDQTIPEARQLKSAGVTMITVAVGFAQRTAELIGLTSKPINDNLVRVENYDALHNLKNKLVTPLCTDENQCRNNPCQNEGFCLDGLGSYQCVCVNGHYGENCEKKCGEAADVVFVLDSSTTVGRETFERMRRYTAYLIREMDAEECDIRIGVLKYSSAPMVQFQIGTYTDTDTMVYAVDNIGYTRGPANMAAAFRSLRTRMFNGGGDRPGVRNIAYLLTDGSADVNAENTLREAELAMEADIRIIPIGVEMRQRDEVNNIAFSQGINTIEIMNDDNLQGLRDQILSPVFDTVDYCAGDPCENGGRCKNGNGGYTCECVPGYTGDNCNRRCQARGDVVFVVDTSRYVGRKELRYIKRFMRSIVRRMAFKRNRFRVGVVQFSNSARVALTLAEGSRKKSTNSGIYGLRKYGGNPVPAQGLQKARLRVLGSKSDRTKVADYVVFITKSMRKENDIISEASKMKMAGIHVIGIGIELSGSDQDFLSYAVSSPLPSYLHLTPDVSGLDAISDTLMKFFCNDHNACSSDPCENGGECINMQNGAYECRCRRGFSGRNCQQECGSKADLVFLLDSSGSVGRKHFRSMKQFVYSIVDQLTIGPGETRVAVATYSSKARMGFHLDQYYSKQKLQNAISALEYRYGNTNTAGGLKMVRRNILTRQRGDRPNVPNILVVVTDGVSNVNPENTIPQAGYIKESGTHIFAIGVGGFQPDELNAIASEPAADNAFLVSDYSDLFTLAEKIVDGTCKDESVCSTNPCRNGGTCIAEINGFSCKCPFGFNGPYCGNECASEKDIVFVLDSSSSVGETNFNSMLDFVRTLVEELSSGNNRNRYAMITYSTDVNLIFSFSRYTDTPSLVSAVSTCRYTPGSTNTAGGLRSAFELLQGSYGSRRSAEDIVVLLTDGESNVNSYDTVPAAETLKASGAHIIGIGIGLKDATELNSVASGSDDVFQTSNFETLKNVKADIVSNTCARG